MNQQTKKFSWAYAFWGVFGYFFHRNQIDSRRPFWKSAGLDIFACCFLCGIINRILGIAIDKISSGTLSLIIQEIIFSILLGLAGAWRFNKFRNDSVYDEDIWKRREKIAILIGIPVRVLTLCSSIFLLVAFGNTWQQGTFSQTSEKFFHENGIICNKFFDVSVGMSYETNEKIENLVNRIHDYCPGETFFRDTVDLHSVLSRYPQLKSFNFNEDYFIHTYPARGGQTAYVFIKKL